MRPRSGRMTASDATVRPVWFPLFTVEVKCPVRYVSALEGSLCWDCDWEYRSK